MVGILGNYSFYLMIEWEFFVKFLVKLMAGPSSYDQGLGSSPNN